jgi:hypothetical protein
MDASTGVNGSTGVAADSTTSVPAVGGGGSATSSSSSGLNNMTGHQLNWAPLAPALLTTTGDDQHKEPHQQQQGSVGMQSTNSLREALQKAWEAACGGAETDASKGGLC